jgi:serine/threonine protein kinase
MAENPVLKDRYRLIEQIGAGGMAVIYKAQDMELGRLVAVKVLRPSLVGDPEFLMRFRREAQAAANLSHPNIVTVHDVGQDGPKTHFIVMEYVDGQDLKKLIRSREEPFGVDAALAIIVEVCKGVGYAHRAGLVHCDIKPQNILVTPDNSIKVTDFGIARALSSAQSLEPDSEEEEIVWGSPHYFSPEQAAGETPTPASDVYSIGVVLFELLTGRLPFMGVDYRELALAHIKQDPPSLMDVDPALPQELDRIIRKVLSKEPAARYRTADQLGRILEKYRQRGQQPTAAFVVKPSVVSSPPPEPEPTIRSARTTVQGEPTIPSLPPINIGAVIGRPAQRDTPPTSRRPSFEEEEDYADALPEDLIPGVDIYGIALGILAALVILGLIPLWLAVLRLFR